MTLNGQARNIFPGFRIFTFGHECTPDAHMNMCNQADDTRAPSTAQFILNDKPTSDGRSAGISRYVMREEDMVTLFPESITPVTVSLPGVDTYLANDGQDAGAAQAIAYARNAATAFNTLQQVASDFSPLAIDAVFALSQGRSVLERFANTTYVTKVLEGVTSLRQQIWANVQQILDPIKRKIVTVKFDKMQRVLQPAFGQVQGSYTNPSKLLTLVGMALRYAFFLKGPIFHSNDPVRIFWRDPFTPQNWFHQFSGFVSDWTISQGKDNETLLTLTCEDVLRSFRYARTSTSPGIVDIDALDQVEDFTVRTFYNKDFSNITLTELFYTLVFGPVQAGTTEVLQKQGDLTPDVAQSLQQIGARRVPLVRYAANGLSSTQVISPLGVGAFNFDRSATFIIGPSTATPQAEDNDPAMPVSLRNKEVRLIGPDALAVYQSVVDHQVRVSDLDDLRLDGEPATDVSTFPIDSTTRAPRIDAIITEIGENPQRYPVDAGRLIILAPASLGPDVHRGIIERDFKGAELQTGYSPRFAIMLDTVQHIEFSLYATPKGDILVEMPLYDFDPEDFGVGAPVSPAQLEAAVPGDGPTAQQVRRLLAGRSVGPFAEHYKLARRDTEQVTTSFQDEHIRTQMQTTWHVAQGWRGVGTLAGIVRDEVVTLRSLVPQFGVRGETAPPPVYVASQAAAAVFCQLKLNQWNAEALTTQVTAMPQMRMGPNRPLKIDAAGSIATIRSISRTIDWTSPDITQTIGVNYTRTWAGEYRETINGEPMLDAAGRKMPAYRTLGGEQARTMNYSVLFQREAPVPGRDHTSPATSAPPVATPRQVKRRRTK